MNKCPQVDIFILCKKYFFPKKLFSIEIINFIKILQILAKIGHFSLFLR